MKLRKSVPFMSACIAFSMILGLVWWAVSEYEDLKPAREPAMEVSEYSEYKVTKVPEEKMRIHNVQQGETLSEIAGKYDLDVDTLTGANESASEVIYPGDRLLILPKKGLLYTVTEGDSLWRIAKLYDVEIKTILAENNKEGVILQTGEKLFIPGAKPRRTEAASVQVSRRAGTRFMTPATGVVSSPFGSRWGRMHEGVDIADEEGTPIRASLGGMVTYAGWMNGYGNTVILEHPQGYTTLYGHMKQVTVAVGAYAGGGQVIGKMGSTGNSTGPHVHFEVRKSGELLNPANILQ